MNDCSLRLTVHAALIGLVPGRNAKCLLACTLRDLSAYIILLEAGTEAPQQTWGECLQELGAVPAANRVSFSSHTYLCSPPLPLLTCSARQGHFSDPCPPSPLRCLGFAHLQCWLSVVVGVFIKQT